MSFTLRRQSAELAFRSSTLVAREWLSPHYVSLRLQGDELRGFDSPGADDHIRIFFAETANADNPRGISREYTPRRWNSEAGTLDIEFVVHGTGPTDGIAGPWAAHAPLGSPLGVGGPRGSLVLDGRPDWWFLAGDESALPAIRRFIEHMDADASGTVLVEVPDASHEQPLAAPAGVTVRWVRRAGTPTAALAAALDALSAEDRPEAASGFVFIAAEQSIVKPGRALAHDRWGINPDHTVIKGYWKSGDIEFHAPH